MRKVTLERPGGERLTFDAWLSGSVDGAAIVSDHPIEDGAMVADHVQAEPLQITLTLAMSERPLGDDGGPYGEERVTAALRFLDEAGRAGDPLIAVIPRVGTLSDMVLARWPANFDNRRAIDLEIVLRQIEFAAVEFVRVPVEAISPPARAGHQEEVDMGKQATEDRPVRERDVSPSLLTQIGGWLGGRR